MDTDQAAHFRDYCGLLFQRILVLFLGLLHAQGKFIHGEDANREQAEASFHISTLASYGN